MRDGFRLGELAIDATSGRVLRPDGMHRLPLRAAAALTALAEYPGQALSRENLTTRVWSDGSGSDDALVRCIGDLRRALGDSGRAHRFIETSPGGGYRLIVTPEPLTETDRRQFVAIPAPPTSSRHAPPLNILLRGTRRQRTLKIVSLYAAAIWPAMQVADLVFPRLGLPDIGVNYVIALGILGFPLVIAFAWFYRPPTHQVVSTGASVRRKAVIVALIGALGTVAYLFAKALEPRPAIVNDRSIAVLPFVNMSGVPANDYLGDGLAEEITNLLTRLPGL